MKTLDQDKVREKVRESYGRIARAGESGSETEPTASCCGPVAAPAESNQTQSCCGPVAAPAESNQTQSCCGPSKESDLSSQPASSCCGSDQTVDEMSRIMGYSKEDIESVPEGANMALGCGNPVALASLKPGETVVDLGSGGGFDCFLAAKEVGATGNIIGVDMTPDMISKSRKNAEKMGTGNVEFRLGEIENLPIADNSADIIMSNCVINLSPDKASVYRNAYRVLKPGGRLSISDVVATARLPEEIQNNLELVSACVGGAATIDDVKEMLKEIGFMDISVVSGDHSRELLRKWDPEKSQNATDYVVSAYIEAVKPQ
ncbi:MAG: arsenite methyltransferase [Proteobacteria bacterium]|nr:arsenite methyltransferase [Pseudomonadota bacterium]